MRAISDSSKEGNGTLGAQLIQTLECSDGLDALALINSSQDVRRLFAVSCNLCVAVGDSVF